MEFFEDIFLTAALWPCVSASNRNEYQEYFLGGKGGQCLGLTISSTSFAVSKSGRLNLLNPQGVQSIFFILKRFSAVHKAKQLTELPYCLSTQVLSK